MIQQCHRDITLLSLVWGLMAVLITSEVLGPIMERAIKDEVARQIQRILPNVHAAGVQRAQYSRQGAGQGFSSGPCRIPDQAIWNIFQRLKAVIQDQQAHIRSQQIRLDALEACQRLNADSFRSIEQRLESLTDEAQFQSRSPLPETLAGNPDAHSAFIPPPYPDPLVSVTQETNELPRFSQQLSSLVLDSIRSEHSSSINEGHRGMHTKPNYSPPSSDIPAPFTTRSAAPVTIWSLTEPPFASERTASAQVQPTHTRGSGSRWAASHYESFLPAHTVDAQPNSASATAANQYAARVTQHEAFPAFTHGSLRPVSQDEN